MRRFTKVASLLAAMSVLACSVAFAAPLEFIPGDLDSATETFVLSQDVTGSGPATAMGDQIVSPDTTGKPGASLLKFDALVSEDGFITVSNAFGVLSTDKTVATDNPAFSKVLVRSTTFPLDMTFVVSLDGVVAPNKINFGLRSGFENKGDNANNEDKISTTCKIYCDNFHYYMSTLSSFDVDASVAARTATANVEWDATGDKEFYVECCDHFGLVASDDSGAGLGDTASTGSSDMVIAHLSETPFLRVRVADEFKVRAAALADNTSRDFRATYWDTMFYNTDGAVDVPEGKTYNMGVAYTISEDCGTCGTTACTFSPLTSSPLPYVAVTNLGTKNVYIEKNVSDNPGLVIAADQTLTSNSSWLCNLWCGLCTYEDMMSGDLAPGWGALEGGLIVGEKVGPAGNHSLLYDCICHLFPAFTNTWKGAGNADFNYRAYQADGAYGPNPKYNENVVTKITGRMNTAWHGDSASTSGLCASCSQTGLFVYYPCYCLETPYEKALGFKDLVFHSVKENSEFLPVKAKTLSLESFNQDKATGDYAAVNTVLSMDVAPAGTDAADVILTKLTWDLSAANLSDAGMLNLASGQWWRSELWNKMDIKINGHVLDASGVTNVSANEMTPAELSFLTVVNGPQRELVATSDIDVNLYVFVVDSDKDAIEYYKTASPDNNRFLVVFDGKKDGKFSVSGSVVKKSGDVPVSDDFALTASTLELNIAVEADKAKTLGTKNVPAGSVVVWTVVSDDIATISATSGDSITVTGVAVGSTTVHAAISGDANVSADCTITVKSVAPSGDSGGGGCNVGFAPALLLLLAPLAFLKK